MAQPNVGVHGRKRPAAGELDDQPLAKRFDRLQLDPFTPLRLPGRQDVQAHLEQDLHESIDMMMLDDTKHTVYIHDLEQELAESEAFSGNHLTILPGLEDKLRVSNLLISSPKHQCTEMVLYKEPESLSIPKHKDQVRRALIGTRERARLGLSGTSLAVQVQPQSHGIEHDQDLTTSHSAQKDLDKMDVDTDVQY
ncbi:hypothetical protein BJX99DRAFT_251207 [Aspergillus californicus]